MWFTSDNAAPAHPSVLEALTQANAGYSASYGADPIMEDVTARIREIFEAPDAAVYLVATGTAANALALACLCPPWATVYCHRNAHVEEDECAAPEFYTGGAKLTLLDGPDAKIDPASFEAALGFTARAGVHNVQKGALSITNITEAGTLYSLSEMKALTDLAHEHNCPTHLDGARFTNALVALGCTPAELTWKAGIDAVSFGGTKNGLMGVEAIILFDPARAWELELRRKRGAHLFSKHRYLSAQMQAYLKDDLWLRLARQANDRAAQLSRGLMQTPNARLLHPTDGNGVFAGFPREAHKAAQEAGAKYYFWPFNQSLDGPGDEILSARLMCSWSTTAEEVDEFVSLVKSAS
ncbi:threonine aldolase family protein [Algicella marina]|uniref:L-threonine aldolase n=1 Tax=Algicella marina TaxID=2683284 RepID=A0A6P1T2H8_9RHOB|nr:beta-eliminating lyase-related protein [Algicella marina]QHQ36207.1 low specificity L-threonine aldolase [Algicella marina]